MQSFKKIDNRAKVLPAKIRRYYDKSDSLFQPMVIFDFFTGENFSSIARDLTKTGFSVRNCQLWESKLGMNKPPTTRLG